MGDLITLHQITSLDIPADRVLSEAMGEMDKAIVMGYDKEGEFYFASSIADGGDVLWLLENMKINLLQLAHDGDDL